jgi:3-hydroxybutyrate dehydrogenase
VNKDEVSRGYITAQKVVHAGLELPPDRRVLITGAGHPDGIGAAIVRRLSHAYFDHFKGDVRKDLDAPPWGAYDTLIAVHGVTHLDWIENFPTEKAREILEVNLLANIAMTTAFVNATLHQPYRKQIFFIGSLAHRAVLNGSAAYCASKAGLQHFARCAAWELAPKGYDVFCINPSNTLGTAMTEETIVGLMRYRHLTREEAEGYWGAVLPKANWLTPSDIADLVEWLFSGKGEYLSGTALDLPGGQR